MRVSHFKRSERPFSSKDELMFSNNENDIFEKLKLGEITHLKAKQTAKDFNIPPEI